MRMRLLCFFVALGVLGVDAQAQLGRSAVSVAGSDANACTTVLPCRTINYALGQTASGGELIVLDSGGYGAFTVTQAVTIEAAPGVYAGVTVSSGDGAYINASSSDRIVIRGLTFNGLGVANSAISFTGGGAELFVENCVIDGFANYGIIAFLNIRISDTVIRGCGSGIWIDNAGATVKASIERVQVSEMSGGDPQYPGTGILAWRNSTVVVREAVVAFTYAAFEGAGGGKLNIDNCLASNSFFGIIAVDPGTIVRVSRTMTTANTTGWTVASPAKIETFSSNRTAGNATNVSGTPTAVPSS